MKTKIYRRLFNPKADDIQVKQLVATFPAGMEAEADACFSQLQRLSTSFSDCVSDGQKQMQKYRFTKEQVHPTGPVGVASEGKGIQVDCNLAKRTGRPIKFEMSWHIIQGQCHCIAYHTQYGKITGIVDDSPKGRHLFINRVKDTWPNADLTKH